MEDRFSRWARGQFPQLLRPVQGRPLAYLDNAATSLKPTCVLEALDWFYRAENGAVHRAVHSLGAAATQAYEDAREAVARFVNARSAGEVVFVRGTTEAINLVAHGLGFARLREGDEIVISSMEHHSNLVPWLILRDRLGVVLRFIPMTEAGELDLDVCAGLLNARTRLVALSHVSNALGTVHPVRSIVERARAVGALVLVDGAQRAPHGRIDVQELDCDFYAFSGHKVFGPTGIGVLWARAELLDSMPPQQSGGSMIRTVSLDRVEYAAPPHLFEAGTPNVAGAVGLAAAIEFIESIGWRKIEACEAGLLRDLESKLESIPGLRILGRPKRKVPLASFVVEGIHPHDLGTFADQEGVAIRTGHHCAMPVMHSLGVPATARASLAFYNRPADIDALVDSIAHAQEVFRS